LKNGALECSVCHSKLVSPNSRTYSKAYDRHKNRVSSKQRALNYVYLKLPKKGFSPIVSCRTLCWRYWHFLKSYLLDIKGALQWSLFFRNFCARNSLGRTCWTWQKINLLSESQNKFKLEELFYRFENHSLLLSSPSSRCCAFQTCRCPSHPGFTSFLRLDKDQQHGLPGTWFPMSCLPFEH